MRGARVFRLRMPSRRTAVAPTVERILQAVVPAGLDQEQTDDLAVAVAEALSNAAVHGNRLRPSANVLVAVETTPDECTVVEIKDSGAGFDRSRLHDPTDNAHILMPGGRGVFLMRRLVDRLEYNPLGNCVRLTMHARNGHPVGGRSGRDPKK
jgi:serine/threonine-protein kinase RsbW